MSDNVNKTEEPKVYGNVAKLGKGTNPTDFMANIKLQKNKLWYIVCEKQDDEIHAIKFTTSEQAFKMNEFVVELKKHYMGYFKTKNQDALVKMIEKIQITGNDKFSILKNIPKVKINEKMLVSRITEDLIVLLNNTEKSSS